MTTPLVRPVWTPADFAATVAAAAREPHIDLPVADAVDSTL